MFLLVLFGGQTWERFVCNATSASIRQRCSWSGGGWLSRDPNQREPSGGNAAKSL